MICVNELPTRPGNLGGCTLDAGNKFFTVLALWAQAFPGSPRNVSEARQFVAHLLQGSPFCDEAVVVLSELFTNAVLHTDSGKPGGLVTVQVARWRHGTRVAVTDQGSLGQPVIRDLGVGGQPAESGHGLYLAAQLADALAWYDDPAGRTIAAILGKAGPAYGSLGSRTPHPVIPGPGGRGEWPWPS